MLRQVHFETEEANFYILIFDLETESSLNNLFGSSFSLEAGCCLPHPANTRGTPRVWKAAKTRSPFNKEEEFILENPRCIGKGALTGSHQVKYKLLNQQPW